jgi:hypothetical protein
MEKSKLPLFEIELLYRDGTRQMFLLRAEDTKVARLTAQILVKEGWQVIDVRAAAEA